MLSFNKPIGILFGNGQHWKQSRRIIMKLLREHKLRDQAHLEELYSSEIRLLLEDLRGRIEQSKNHDGSALFSPGYSFDEPVLNIVFKTLFGRRLTDEEKKEGGILDRTHYCNSNFTAFLSALEYFPFLKYFPKLTWLGSVMELCNMIYDLAAVSLRSPFTARMF